MSTKTMIQKTLPSVVNLGDDPRTLIARISTIAVDRDGESLQPLGMNSKEYQLNPVICMSHDYNALPVGKCLALKRFDDRVEARIQFAERPESYPADQEWLPETLFSLYKQGVLNAFSVGLIPIESRPATDRDIEKFGAGCRRVISKWSLLEVSVCTIPCNGEAVAIAVGKGILTTSVAKQLFNVDIPESPVKEIVQEIAQPAKSIHLREHIIDVPVVKHIHRVLGQPERKLDIARMVKRKIQKLRGAIYEH